MGDTEDFRKRNLVLLPDHQKSRFPVPVGREAAAGTPKGASFRGLHRSATGAGATGASFFREARCDAGFLDVFLP